MQPAVHDAVFRSQPQEHSLRVTSIQGTIPPELSGTLLRNGPGLMELGSDGLNFFDGHALIAGVTFADGAAVFRSRYVRTPLYASETQAKAVTTRHVFTNHPSRWKNFLALKIANTAMHDVYAWGDGEHLRVVAGNDPGHFALDPRSLETRGSERWSGAAPAGCDMGPMPCTDANTGRVVGYVKKPGLPEKVKFVELDGQFRAVKETPFFALQGAGLLLHDQRATASHYLLTQQGYRLSVPSALWGSKTLFDSFELGPDSTAALVLVPRAGGSLITAPLPKPWKIAFHIINAFDQGERMVVDVVAYEGAIGFSRAAPRSLRARLGNTEDVHGPPPTPLRLIVDPAKGQVLEARRLGDAFGDAPEINDARMGLPYRFAYFPTPMESDASPDHGAYFHFGGIAKLDVDSGGVERWAAGDGVVSPVAFVPRPGAKDEDDGWLLAWVLGVSGARVVILDARAVSRGPLATLELGVHLPGVSHVRWARDVRLSSDA